MDRRSIPMSDLAVSILGVGVVAPEGLSLECAPANRETVVNVATVLRDRKTLKFMAKQDQMALAAAHQAVTQAGLDARSLQDRTGLYFCVGIIPFEQQPLDALSESSQRNGEFDMTLFATRGLNSTNPLLTFKCLPNMPAYHVSANLDIHQRYCVSYPGAGQWAQCLQQAIVDLQANRIDYAVVGSVADQRNPLVQHHIARTIPSQTDNLVDAACVLVIARALNHSTSVVGMITALRLAYQSVDIINSPASDTTPTLLPVYAGCVNPALALALRLHNQETFSLAYQCRDGLSVQIAVAPP